MAAPKAPFRSSTGIRAPLTLDDDSDFEYSASTSGKKDGALSSSSSDSEFLTDGSGSGDDQLEKGSKRPFVSSSDSGILEETHFVEKHVLTRPPSKYPNEVSFQENSSLRVFDDSGPSLFDENEEVVEDNDDLEEYRDRLSAAAIEDETLRKVWGKNGSGIQGMPIAQLSWDSDDDSVGNESSEEDSSLGIVKVPDSGFLEKFDNAPKVGVLDVGEVEDSASQTENLSEVEILEELIAEGVDEDVMNSGSEENHPFIELTAPDYTLAAAIEDNDPRITEQVEDGGLEDGIKVPDSSNLIVEEIKHANMLGDGGPVEHILPLEAVEADASEIQAVENIELASVDSDSQRNQNLDMDGTVTHSHNSKMMMNEIEQNEVKAHDFSAPNNIEYAKDDVTVWVISESVNDAELSEMEVAQKLKCFEDVPFSDITENLLMEDKLPGQSNLSQALHQSSSYESDTSAKVDNDSVPSEEEEALLQSDATQGFNFGGSERVGITEQQEEHVSSGSLACGGSCQSHSQVTDAMSGAYLKDEPNNHAYLQEEDVTHSSASGVPQGDSAGVELEGDGVPFMPADGNRLIHFAQLASLGLTVHSFGPTTELNSAAFLGPPQNMAGGESSEFLSEEEKKKLEKLQHIRVKFLRLVHRLKLYPEDSIVAKVLYQLLLASGRSSAQEFSFEFAKQAAMELEAEGNNNLNFSLNILVIGKSGVGKSATINSIFGEDKAVTNAFQPGTTGLREVQGKLDGIPVRILDTPGLRSSLMEQSTNRKILSSIKKLMKNFSPDVILYVDRLDLQTRDLNDLPLLKSVNNYLGSSLWSQTILTLTHAASAPPEGPSGHVLSYKLFVAQRSYAVRQLISHSLGNPHIIKSGLIPVALVENFPVFETKESEHILPSYEDSWRSKLLCLCYSMKILSEIYSTIQPKGTLNHSKFLGLEARSLPLPYFLSSLLQTSVHPKLSTAQGGVDVDSDIELAYSSDSDKESEDEYDQLPEFRPLTKSQIAYLEEVQRKAYFDEYNYRVKLLQKKQLKEEGRKARDIKNRHKEGALNYANVDDVDEEMKNPEALALTIPLPDMSLPPVFDGDNPSYRYRILELSPRIMARPVLDSHGWDHDYGFDGVNIEGNLAIAGHFPAAITIQLAKDKRLLNIHLTSSVSTKNGENGSSMAGLDIETIGKRLAYTLKTETKMKNFKVNKSAAGISTSFLAGDVITGFKVEDQVAVGKNLTLVGTTGLSLCQSDAAYGTNLAIRYKDKNCPLEQELHLIGLSLMRWRGDNVLGLNLQSEFSLGHHSKFGIKAGLNSKKSGQISVRISSSHELHIALLGLLPVAKTMIRKLFCTDR